jgi:hypothetical protein
MSKIDEVDLENAGEDFKRNLYRLLLFYKQLTQLLETFFSGYLLMSTDELNRNYLRLCSKIKEILKNPSFENLAGYDWQPFDNLRALDSDAPGVEWEYGGRQICGNFLSAIEEVFINNGEKTYPLNDEDQQLFDSIQNYLERYRNYKSSYEKRWSQRVEKQDEEWRKKQEKPQVEIPEFGFEFIRDEEIKNLLIRDWNEAQKAFENELYKATVVLCGTVLEALLIDALSCINEEAKFSYYQKYLEGKNKRNKPPEIENWLLYQLIEIAKQQGVITSDVAKLSHIVRDYRNLIHLWAQKSEQLRVDSHIASAVVNLLTVAYNDIAKWHIKRRNE